MTNELSIPALSFLPAIIAPLAAACAAMEALPEIVDTATCEEAVKVNAMLGKAIKGVEKARATWTAPLLAAQKAAIAAEKEATAQATEYSKLLAKAIGDYQDHLRVERAKASALAFAQEQALREQEAASGVEVRSTPPLVATTLVEDAPKIPSRKVARLVITDETKIPRAYFKLDEKLLLDDLKSGMEIHGAEIGYEDVLVRR